MPTKGRVQVAPGQLIQSAAWGNPLWDQSIQCFNSTADRDTQYPSASVHDGAIVWTAAEQTFWVRQAGAWVRLRAGDTTRLWSSKRTTGAGMSPAVFNLAAGLTVTAAAAGVYLILCSVVQSRPASLQAGYTRVTVNGAGFGDYVWSSNQYDQFTRSEVQNHAGGDMTVNLYTQMPVAYNLDPGCAVTVIGI